MLRIAPVNRPVMSIEKKYENSKIHLESRCFEVLRTIRQDENKTYGTSLDMMVERLERVLFSAKPVKRGRLLECYIDLVATMEEMNTSVSEKISSLRPIGLQVATSNNVIPIQLEWNYDHPNSLFVIEYAQFEDSNQPEWKVYSKTNSTSFTVRGLPKGKSYWFRISALAPVG